MVTSYNGWPASPKASDIGVVSLQTAGGVDFPPGVRMGDVYKAFKYLVDQLELRVAKPKKGWCWGYNFRKNRNANNLSCHGSATAIDWDAPLHPNDHHGTFTPEQVAEIRQILAELDHCIRWGGDFHGTKDEMHFEICVSETTLSKAVAKLEARLAAPKKAAVPVDPRLHAGTSGQKVLNVQRALQKAGYYDGTLDGQFDMVTDAALRRFQAHAGLNPDGITWASTWAALRKV